MNQKDIMKLASGMWRDSEAYEQQRYKDMFEDKLSTYRKTVKVCINLLRFLYDLFCKHTTNPVSYTHLTLPTI